MNRKPNLKVRSQLPKKLANSDLTRHHLTQQGFRPVTSPVTSPVTNPSPTRHQPVTNPSPMKKLNRILINLKFWQWAAMHSPRFQYFQLRLIILPVTVCVHWSMWTKEQVVFKLTINIVRMVFDFPCSEPLVFIHVIKNQGRIINPDIFNDILIFNLKHQFVTINTRFNHEKEKLKTNKVRHYF